MNKKLSRLLITIEAMILAGVLVVGFLGGLGTLGSMLISAITERREESKHEVVQTEEPADTESEVEEELIPGSESVAGSSETEEVQMIPEPETETETETVTEVETETEEEIVVYEKATYLETPITFSDEVESLIANMTLEQKIGQLFLITPEELVNMNFVRLAGDTTRSSIQERPVFGLRYTANNFTDQEQMLTMVSNTQQYAGDFSVVPMMMAVKETGSEEQSPIASLLKHPYVGSSDELSSKGDQAVESAAAERASYLKESGFSMVFTTNVEDLKPAENAAQLIISEIKGSKSKGITTVVGTFPWKQVPNEKKTFHQLMTSDFAVFQQAIDAGAEIIMVSNSTADMVSGQVPCTMSSQTVDILRGNMGFKGVLVTEPMNDPQITDHYLGTEAAVDAINAGMDMISSPLNFNNTYDKVLEAVTDGSISEVRLHNALGRILTMKLNQ